MQIIIFKIYRKHKLRLQIIVSYLIKVFEISALLLIFKELVNIEPIKHHIIIFVFNYLLRIIILLMLNFTIMISYCE